MKNSDIRSFFGMKPGSQGKSNDSSQKNPPNNSNQDSKDSARKTATPTKSTKVENVNTAEDYGWTCDKCTLDNAKGIKKCVACGNERPANASRIKKKVEE